MQAELDLRVSQDQVSALKKHNAQLACRCREEAKAKLKEHDERVETQDKVIRVKQDETNVLQRCLTSGYTQKPFLDELSEFSILGYFQE